MQNHLEFIVNVLSWFKNFFSGGNPLTNIYNAIIRLPANIYKSVSEWVSEQIEKVKTKFNEIITTITTKITDIISTITTKLEGIFGGGGKTGSELTAAVWEEIKKDPMFSGLSEAQQEYLARTASGEKYWKNDATGEYKYSAASPGEGWRDFTAQGSTEISRGEGIGISSHMKAKANKIAEDLRNPAALKLPTLKLPTLAPPAAIQAADEKIADIAEEGQEKADEAIANRDFLGFMINQYSMGAKVIMVLGESALNLLTGKTGEEDTPSMDVGGTITGSGSIIGHAGEEVSPASAVVGAKTTLERMTEAAEGGIEANTKPADKIAGSAYVEGGLQAYGRVLLDRLFGGSPSMDAGGTVTGSGSIIGHRGEEVSPASAVVGAKTTLESMTEAAEGGQAGSIAVGDTTININVDRIDSDIDLERALAKAGDEFDRQLMFRLRNLLDSGNLRGIGYLRG